MATRALFAGLVVDENENPVTTAEVGGEAFYVVDDDGFLRHIESEYVDRQVLTQFADLMKGHEGLISEGAMKMLGQEDIFTKAAIEASLKNMEAQFDTLLAHGLPEDQRTWLGMMGFRVVIDYRGEVVQVVQPATPSDESD